MQYYAAPMEGLTDRVWRQAQQKWFGPEGTAHRYYGCSSKRRWRSLPPPQIPVRR